MAEDLIAVNTYGQATEAHMAKSVLEAAGVQAFLENEHTVTMAPYLSAPSGVKLLVKQSDAQKANEILAAH